jgi:hypothetical protein
MHAHLSYVLLILMNLNKNDDYTCSGHKCYIMSPYQNGRCNSLANELEEFQYLSRVHQVNIIQYTCSLCLLIR